MLFLDLINTKNYNIFWKIKKAVKILEAQVIVRLIYLQKYKISQNLHFKIHNNEEIIFI